MSSGKKALCIVTASIDKLINTDSVQEEEKMGIYITIVISWHQERKLPKKTILTLNLKNQK